MIDYAIDGVSKVGFEGSLEFAVAADAVESGELIGEERFGEKAQLSNSAFCTVSAFFQLVPLNVDLAIVQSTSPLFAVKSRYFS